MRDLQYAACSRAVRPGFTLVAVVTPALGIGASAAIIAALHADYQSPTTVLSGE
jgi:hypothetical protein